MLLTRAPELDQADTGILSGTRARPFARERIPFLACEVFLLGLVVIELWAHILAIRNRVALPFQVDYEEGNILNALVRITHGLTPYPDPRAIPNILSPYGPVAYYLFAIPVKLFGVSFTGPRLIIAGCMAAICCFIGLSIARQTRSPLVGVVFGGIYGTLPAVESWSTILRVDFLALALCAAGVYVFTRATDAEAALYSSEEVPPGFSSTNRFLYLSVWLFVAALFVKYTYIAAPAACALYLLIQRQWRQAARFVGFVAAASAALMLVLMFLTRGTIVIHLFRTHADPFSLDDYVTRMSAMMVMCRVLAVLAAVYLVGDLLRRRLSVPALWLLLATASAVTAGKLGSNWNHFLEWPAALCLCAGLGWETMVRARPRVLVLATLLALTTWLGLFVRRERNFPYDPYITLRDCSQVYRAVKQYPGDRILSENVGALVLAGKTVWISNPFVYSQMVMRGGWPDAGLQRMVSNREFDLILAEWNYPEFPSMMSAGAERFSSGVVKAIAQNYRAVRYYDCTDARVIFERK